MQKHKTIKALFFLGIFSMLLMHQVVPHWHHQHQEEHQHSEVAHSHNHEHHHETPEKDNSKLPRSACPRRNARLGRQR